MANTSALYVRIDTEVKEKAESILTQLGISPTSAPFECFTARLFVKTVFL